MIPTILNPQPVLRLHQQLALEALVPIVTLPSKFSSNDILPFHFQELKNLYDDSTIHTRVPTI